MNRLFAFLFFNIYNQSVCLSFSHFVVFCFVSLCLSSHVWFVKFDLLLWFSVCFRFFYPVLQLVSLNCSVFVLLFKSGWLAGWMDGWLYFYYVSYCLISFLFSSHILSYLDLLLNISLHCHCTLFLITCNCNIQREGK